MIVCTRIAQYGLHTVFHAVVIIDYLMGTDERMAFANSEKEYHIVGFHDITKIIDEKIAFVTLLKKPIHCMDQIIYVSGGSALFLQINNGFEVIFLLQIWNKNVIEQIDDFDTESETGDLSHPFDMIPDDQLIFGIIVEDVSTISIVERTITFERIVLDDVLDPVQPLMNSKFPHSIPSVA